MNWSTFNGGLFDGGPGGLPAPATSYTLSLSPAPVGAGAVLTATVTPDGVVASDTITLTPSGQGASGLTARTIVFNNESGAKTTTWTPAQPGTLTIAASDSAGLAGPGPASVQVIVSAPVWFTGYFGTSFTAPDSITLAIRDGTGNPVATVVGTAGGIVEGIAGSGNFSYYFTSATQGVGLIGYWTATKGALTDYDQSPAVAAYIYHKIDLTQLLAAARDLTEVAADQLSLNDMAHAAIETNAALATLATATALGAVATAVTAIGGQTTTTGVVIKDASITSAKFGTITAGLTGFLERLQALSERFFPKAGGSVTFPKSGNGSTVLKTTGGASVATSAVQDDGTTQTLGTAS